LQEFRDVLYDPAADPGRFGVSLSNSQEMILSNCCNSGVFLQTQIAEIADQLKAVRKSFDHSQSS